MKREEGAVVIADTWINQMIADWNLTDQADAKLEITNESIDMLDEKDVDVIAEAILPTIVPSNEEITTKNTQKKTSTNESKASSAEQQKG